MFFSCCAWHAPCQAVQLAGYFGPARVVFALLDGSDDGNISWQEYLRRWKSGMSLRHVYGWGTAYCYARCQEMMLKEHIRKGSPPWLVSRCQIKLCWSFKHFTPKWFAELERFPFAQVQCLGKIQEEIVTSRCTAGADAVFLRNELPGWKAKVLHLHLRTWAVPTLQKAVPC